MQQTINIPEGFELVQTSETTYEIKKKSDLPKTWEEFCETHQTKTGECFIDKFSSVIDMREDTIRHTNWDKNLLPSKSDAEGILALMQLIQLRDCYNDGWKPDWKDAQSDKYTIRRYKDDIVIAINGTNNHVLSFKTPNLRDMFLANFKDLIETAKDFI